MSGQEELHGEKPAISAVSPASPPSIASSPSHDFSFTISLRSSKPHQSSFALDLSPADEIFFHGHLLPLHLLSNLPTAPRSSTNSLDSFTLPSKEPRISINEPSNARTLHKEDNRICRGGSESFSIHGERNNMLDTIQRSKVKPFSIFGWRKDSNGRVKEDGDKDKLKQGFDVSEFLKKYARMMRPLLLKKKEATHFHRQSYSFSDTRTWRNRKQWRGQMSAPASRRTSPGNSGVLLPIPSSTSDSSMEELQAAIQAAIAHCKNSSSSQEKITLQAE